MKLTLDDFLLKHRNKKVLFLGREELFSHQESQRFLKRYDIELVTTLDNEVVALVEHHRLNPAEEDISYQAYDRGLPLYKLEEFEKLLSDSIDDDQLLMSLKLSSDQERVYRLITNTHISNKLFIKLLEIYKWSDDEDEDDNQDRGVVMATLRRFLNYKPNEEDLLYTALSIKRLIGETRDPNLLKALLNFPNYRFMQKGKQWIRLREVVATNPHIDRETIQKLIRYRDNRVIFYLSANSSMPLSILKEFIKMDDQDIDEALATNHQIDDELFAILLGRGDRVGGLLLAYQPIDMSRIEMIDRAEITRDLYTILGQNIYLDEAVIEYLLSKDIDDMIESLATNPSLSQSDLKSIYDREVFKYHLPLATNPSTPIEILQEIYSRYSTDQNILINLASNPSTPVVILRELFDLNIYGINEKLAANPSLPIELLNILKIDTRLRNALTSNKTFTDSITKQLGL